MRRHDLGFLGDDEAKSESLVHFDSARHKDCPAEQSLQASASALSRRSVRSQPAIEAVKDILIGEHGVAYREL